MPDWYDLGGSAISAVASLFGADSQSRNVKRTNETNLQIARETNANSMQIARENNELQLASMRENNAFNRQSAIDMFNMEAAYNSPEAQKERLLKAGINPATLYGQGGSIGGTVNASTPVASASGISPSMPSLVAPRMETPPSVLNTMFGNLESVSRIVSNIARSSLDRASKQSTLAKLQPEIDKILADTANTEVKTKHENLMLSLDQIFAFSDRSRKVKKELQEIKTLSSQFFLNSAKAFESEANTDLRKIETILTRTRNDMLKEQAPIILQNLKEEGDLLRAKQKTEGTQQKANMANAWKMAEEARTTKVMRDLQETEQKIKNGILSFDFQKRDKGFDKEVNTYLKQIENAGKVSDEELKNLHELAELARKKNTAFYWQMFLEAAKAAGAGVAAAALAL